ATPALRLGVEGTFLPPSSPDALPVRALNVASVEVAIAPLDPASAMGFEKKRLAHGAPEGEVFDFVASLPGSQRSTVAFEAKKNQVREGGVRLGDGRGAGGPVAIALRWPGESGPVRDERVVQFTDLALSAKASKGSSVAWVTRLSTGEPVPGAKLELWDLEHDGPLAEAEADGDGLARLDALSRPKPGGQLFVRVGAERAALGLDDEISLGRYDLPYGDAGELRGLVYGDRGIYRPGDAVRLGGLVRKTTATGLETPAGEKVSVVVSGPEGEKFLEFDETLSPTGAFAHELALPATSKLGAYSIAARLGPEEPGEAATLRARFEVAEYRPAEFQVQVETDRPAYGRGDELTCRARGTLLSGPAMAGAAVRAVLVREEASYEVPGAEGFETGDAAYYRPLDARTPRAGQLRGDQGELDGEGGRELRARLDLPAQRGPERVICEAEVSDVSNQAQAGRAGALVHPASFYLGLKPPAEGFARAGDAIEPAVIAADPAGARVAGVKAGVELIERRWVIARQKGKQGRGHSESTLVDRVAARCAATTGAEPTPCRLRVPRAGHFVVRAPARDERKRPVGASYDLYATGAGEPGWADNDEGRVELVPEKASYAVGDVARVLVKNPFGDAEALVTV
ncbi:MAG TPA: MG2 domain-containing protein, partial [Polyangiaceae bacterium]|nr:MG2 domain-containing protein [Polyangiaceae bacterium]